MPKVLRGQLFLSVGQEPLYGTENYPIVFICRAGTTLWHGKLSYDVRTT